MANKKNRSRNAMRGSRVYSKSVSEQAAYNFKWRNHIEQLALSRFQWNNLPESIDERYLERTLMMKGQAVFFKGPGDLYYATQVAFQGPFNLYFNPTKMTSIGEAGWYYDIPDDEGIAIWASQTRVCDYPIILTAAEELAEIESIRRQNRRQQRNLVILAGKLEQASDLDRLRKDLEVGEWVTVATDEMKAEGITPLNTNIPYLVEEFQQEVTNKLNEIYSLLGIEHLPYDKSERLVTAEAGIATDAVARIREDALLPRQQAADAINEKFGLDISVEWRTDQKELIAQTYGENEHNNKKDEDSNG